MRVKILILAICVILLLTNINAWAQKNLSIEVSAPIPSTEEFKPTNGVISLKAVANGNKFSDNVRLYNADGSLWFEYSLDSKNPLFYQYIPNPGYKAYDHVSFFVMPAIRVMAASANWYEVVVNEDTKKVKYTRRNDPFLSCDNWEYHIALANYIEFDRKKNPFLESPDGKEKSITIAENDEVMVTDEIEGDWVKVKRVPLKGDDEGWIRWRDGSDILIQLWVAKKKK